MSIAALTHPSLLTPLQSLFRWFAAGAAPVREQVRVAPKATTKVGADATDFVADFSGATGTISINRSPSSAACTSGRVRPTPRPMSRPLARTVRVSRLVEEGQAAANVGRMVISGRMEDVCAELDRLAAMSSPTVREATLH